MIGQYRGSSESRDFSPGVPPETAISCCIAEIPRCVTRSLAGRRSGGGGSAAWDVRARGVLRDWTRHRRRGAQAPRLDRRPAGLRII